MVDFLRASLRSEIGLIILTKVGCKTEGILSWTFGGILVWISEEQGDDAIKNRSVPFREDSLTDFRVDLYPPKMRTWKIYQRF